MRDTTIIPMDDVSEKMLEIVAPVFANRVRQLAADLGFVIEITVGFKSSAMQTALYAQGRLPLTTVNILRKKVNLPAFTMGTENVKITEVPPYHNWHEFGMAVDIALVVPVPNWDTTHQDWRKILELAAQFDLVGGMSWKGEPHLQPKEIPPSPTPQYVAMLQKDTPLPEIWKFAELAA